MDDEVLHALGDDEAYVVGGAVRDELLGRPVLDVDIACREPERAARAYRVVAGGTVFLLSGRHGAWRVALAGERTLDFVQLRGSIEEDLAGRDFTINAIAVPARGGDPIDPFSGREDLEARRLRAVTDDVFVDDPLRLLRAVRLEEELGVRLVPVSEALVRRDASLVTRPAGERVLAELLRLTVAGYRRLDELGLLEPLGGSTERLGRLDAGHSSELVLVACLGEAVSRLPISNELRRFARVLLAASRPRDSSPREIHRFRRSTEPWALEALSFLGAPEYRAAVEAGRAADVSEPLLRGNELGLEPGPEVGRLLARIAEERAAGTIESREDALQLVERERAG
jgi:tRNA nucleotidyltransferase/poly(A) polymerase